MTVKYSKRDKLIAVVGTNASGKSSLGIEMALRFSGEIISADSRQVYRGFDLCSGKVTNDERKKVKHYLIDICDISNRYSVSQYQHDVYKLIPCIYARNKNPFIVGGTGLYVDSVIKGYDLPEQQSDTAFRAYLESCSLSQLQSMLSRDAYIGFANNKSELMNRRRLIRVIEKEKYGQPLKHLNTPLYETLQLGLTWPEPLLFDRIRERLTARLNDGMIDEIDNYLTNGGNVEYLYSLGLEYKYITWFIEGRYASYTMFYEDLARAIRRFAKRQVKWFRRNNEIRWLNMSGDFVDEASVLIENFLESSDE